MQNVAFSEKVKDEVRVDPYRPGYHITPPMGWMNDPNGLIYYNQTYHVFYQYYPYKPVWGPMHWGHVVSDDLVSWRHLPIALTPDSEYDFHHEMGGCFSGSAIEHDGRLVLMYTGCVKDRKLYQTQCIAESEDGINFTKHEANPVIPMPPEEGSREFRDPKVWKNGDTYYVVIGSEKDEIGQILLYRSKNLISWEYVGVAARGDKTQGEMWECPDLFSLGGKDVLIFSPIKAKEGRTHYISGTLHYPTGKLHKDLYGRVDYGPDFYAPQTFSDAKRRRIMIGWLSRWDAKIPTKDYGWAGQLSIPRELWVDQAGRLHQKPVDELKKLRESCICVDLSGNQGVKPVPGIAGDMLELELEVSGEIPAEFGLMVRCSSDLSQRTIITVNAQKEIFEVDRTLSGEGDSDSFAAPIKAETDGRFRLHIFLDRNSMEIFTAQGETAASCNIYPGSHSTGIMYFSSAASSKVQLKAWTLSLE